MDNITKKSFDFLQNYLNNASPVGYETSGQKIWLDYIKPYVHQHFTDIYGTAVAVINPDAKYKVVLESHADEISWFVNYIDENGYIYVIRNGYSDHQIAPSKKVNFHTDKGIVKGVFGWLPVHARDDDEESPTIKNIFIDVGAESKDEVEEMGIHVGVVATFEDEMSILNNKYLVGRALDNRIGGFMIAEVARLLHENGKELDFGLYIVNAVQEEIGLRGAQMIANRIKPDVAIVTDVCHDTQSPMFNKTIEGDFSCGDGPVLTYAPAVQNNLLKMIIDVANKNNIAFQRAAACGETGTDTDAFAYSNNGVASALVSIPLSYMHTTVEKIHKDDIKSTIELLYCIITELKADIDFRYIK